MAWHARISFIFRLHTLLEGASREESTYEDEPSLIALRLLSLVNLKCSLTMVTPKKLFLFLALGLIVAPTGESLLIGHHRVLKSQDYYNPDPVRISLQKSLKVANFKLKIKIVCFLGFNSNFGQKKSTVCCGEKRIEKSYRLPPVPVEIQHQLFESSPWMLIS